jgi:hypothetical protein
MYVYSKQSWSGLTVLGTGRSENFGPAVVVVSDTAVVGTQEGDSTEDEAGVVHVSGSRPAANSSTTQVPQSTRVGPGHGDGTRYQSSATTLSSHPSL